METETTLSETQFSKAGWRPGKRRRTQPRQRCYGGQKEAPLWLLAAGRLVGLHTDRAARCTRIAASTGKRCRHVAMKGSNLCLSHGGAVAAKRIRPYVSTMPALNAKVRKMLEKAEAEE
jgi:hypothetical protein